VVKRESVRGIREGSERGRVEKMGKYGERY